MPDEPATPPSSRAHEFDSTCNCGDCLADRGIEPAPATPPVQQSSRVRDWTVEVRMARDFYPTFKAFLGLDPELCLYRAEELTRAATPPEQESSRVDPKDIATVKALYSRAQSAAIYRIIDALEAQAPAPEPAQPPTEQGPTRGEPWIGTDDDPADAHATSDWAKAMRVAEELAENVRLGMEFGTSLDGNYDADDMLAVRRALVAAYRPVPTEQGDLAARFEALADLALKKCEEECLSDGAPNPFREEMAQAKAYRYAAELARDHARATSGTEGEA